MTGRVDSSRRNCAPLSNWRDCGGRVGREIYIPIEKLPPAHADSEKLPPALLPALRLAAALALWRRDYLHPTTSGPYCPQRDYQQRDYQQRDSPRPDYFQPDYLQPRHLRRGTGDGQRQPAKAATG